ncbi:MAG: exodeoxyribonuclease VII large subunit [Oscillospiraceae bacterium]
MLNGQQVWSVEEVNNKVKDTISSNPELRNFFVCGEISTITRKAGRRPGSQYLYFTLKDKESPLSCAMFSGVEDIDFNPKMGDKVICGGYIDVYVPFGKYQMIATSMEEYGDGDAAAALRKLIQKLEAEGLFGRKRPFPPFPKKIAVITSATGAVIHDVIETTKMRYPITEICLIPATVQGDGAVPTLIAGLGKAQTIGADVIIIGRGGGSKEDLDCFNDEALARAIFASSIPVISAVGHETDTTIADMVADARASTPTQAAEIATPEIGRILGEIAHHKMTAAMLVNRVLTNTQKEIDLLEKDIKLNSPRGRISQWESELLRLNEAISNNIHRRLTAAENDLGKLVQSVSDLNPLSVLQRGYSLTKSGEKIVSSVNDVSVGNSIEVEVLDGTISAEVKDIKIKK